MTDFMDVNDDLNVDIDSSRKSLLNNNDNLDCLPNLLSESGGEEYYPERIEKTCIKRQATRRRSLRKSQRYRNHFRDYLKLFVPGVVVIILGILTYILDPYNLLDKYFLELRDGSLLYTLWRKLPLKLYIKVYVFNVTNGDRFVRGVDSKLGLNEVGPYVYSDQLTHHSVEFYKNGSLSFIGSHNFTFEPSMSVGDPEKDQVMVTNIALLGIASKLFNAPTAVALGLSSVVSYTNAPAILNMSVKEYLWGYEEPLVSYGSKVLPSWLDFDKLGILDRMLNEGNNRFTISAGRHDRFTVRRINGSPGLKDWGYKPDVDRGVCDLVNGTFDGILYKPHPPDKMYVYRKMFCRPVPINNISLGSLSSNGIRVKEYTISDNAFSNDNPENKCYCYNKAGCFPSGVTDLSPCYYGIPIGMSLPHFLNANASLYSKLDGIKPDPAMHKAYLQLQQDIGIPMYAKIPVQLNVVVRKTKYVNRVKKFDNMIVPIFWLEVNLLQLPDFLDTLIYLMVNVVPPTQIILIWSCIVGGMVLVFVANVRYAWNNKVWQGNFSTRKRASIISYKIKQETRRLSTMSQKFIPLPTIESKI